MVENEVLTLHPAHRQQHHLVHVGLRVLWAHHVHRGRQSRPFLREHRRVHRGRRSHHHGLHAYLLRVRRGHQTRRVRRRDRRHVHEV